MAFDNMILGENAVCSMDCSITGCNNNVIVCGGTGSGKTMSVTEARFLETYNSSLIVNVAKRRIVKKYAPMFRKRGYRVLDLNFAEPDSSAVGYDLLQSARSPEDIAFLASAIVLSNPKKEKAQADPYWDDMAISLLMAEIYYVLMTRDDPSLADVLALHRGLRLREGGDHIATTLDKEFAHLEQELPDCQAVTCWKSFSQLASMKTAGCVFSTLNTTLDSLFTPALCRLLGRKDRVSITDLAREKTVLFITSSAVNPALHCFVNMVFADAFKILFEMKEDTLPVPVSIICDDIAVGARIPHLSEYISIFREKGISITMMLQSEAALVSMYGEMDAMNIVNNCDTYIYLGGMDQHTAQCISDRVNLPLEDVLFMPVGREILMRRGQKPLVTRRYPIQEDSRYQELTREYENSSPAQLQKTQQNQEERS